MIYVDPRAYCPAYPIETAEELAVRLERFFEVAEAIKVKELGSIPAQHLAQRLAKPSGGIISPGTVVWSIQAIYWVMIAIELAGAIISGISIAQMVQ